MANIRIYHSFRSPYSRLGLHVIDRAGLNVALIPFTGPPEGSRFDDPVQNQPKLTYYMQDIPRMTARMGLPINFPNPFEVDLTPAYKASIAAEKDGFALPFSLAVSDVRWGEGKNVSSMTILASCAEAVGWSASGVEAAQSSPAVEETLREHRALIEQDQVFGVPFAVVGEQKFWGHDRFELLVEAVER